MSFWPSALRVKLEVKCVSSEDQIEEICTQKNIGVGKTLLVIGLATFVAGITIFLLSFFEALQHFLCAGLIIFVIPLPFLLFSRILTGYSPLDFPRTMSADSTELKIIYPFESFRVPLKDCVWYEASWTEDSLLDLITPKECLMLVLPRDRRCLISCGLSNDSAAKWRVFLRANKVRMRGEAPRPEEKSLRSVMLTLWPAIKTVGYGAIGGAGFGIVEFYLGEPAIAIPICGAAGLVIGLLLGAIVLAVSLINRPL